MFRRTHVPEHLHFPLHDPICGDWEFFARLSKDAPLCFADCDTVYNRSHTEDVRLTQTGMIDQLTLRVDFLERVYRADTDFYAANKELVDNVWKKRLMRLAVLHLLSSDQDAARAVASKLAAIGGPRDVRQRLVSAACAIPGSGQLIRAARGVKRRL